MHRNFAACTPYVLSIVRIVFGMMLFLHGCQLWGWIVPPGVRHHATPPPGVSAGVEAVLHVLAGTFAIGGGTLLILGLFTPVVAFILSGEMAVAYFLSHGQLGWCPLFNGGESAVLNCFVFLLFSFTGAGEWSLDRYLFRSRRKAVPETAADPIGASRAGL